VANSKRKPGNRKPISSHPLFPAVVALWFGALFGLGSLAIRPTLIESLVLKIGIDLVIPAAAPPLGVTARILIALVMASLGAALGVLLALRLSRPKIVVRERKRNASNPGGAATAEAAMWNQRDIFTDGPTRRPISAHEELGDALDSPVQMGSRRRALAVAEHDAQPFQPQEAAPLPGGEPQIFDIATTELDPVSLAPAAEEERAPLDLGAFAEPAQDPAPMMPAQPQPKLDWSAPLPPEPPIALEPSVTSDPQPAPANPGITDLARRLQESMARRRAAKAEPASAPAPSPMSATPLEPTTAMPSEFGLPAPGQPAFVPPPPIPVYAAAPFTAPSTAAVAPAASAPMPAALRPVALDLAEDEEPVDLAQLMPRHLAMPPGAPLAPFAPEERAEPAMPQADESAFASLLSIETPRQEFVRIEEPEQHPATTVEPVVIFPSQMAAAQPIASRPFDAPSAAVAGDSVAAAPAVDQVDPAEAELALRSALANLQRISGVA